jgi:hypothetical protein
MVRFVPVAAVQQEIRVMMKKWLDEMARRLRTMSVEDLDRVDRVLFSDLIGGSLTLLQLRSLVVTEMEDRLE